jgi:hypothetical protein
VNKCVSCGSELAPQTRFCGACGAIQPDRTKTDEANNIGTLRAAPHGENAPANIPPPPPQFSQFGQEENQPNAGGSMGQPGNPPSGPHPQPQTFYGDYQQAQPHQAPYGNYQSASQAPPPYGGYQSTAEAQPPYNYQPNPPSQPPYGNYQSTQPYGDYQQPPSPYNYQPTPQPASAGMHASETVAPVSTGTAGTRPATPQATTKWAVIGVIVVVILAGSGVGYFLFLKPALAPTPTISVTSDFHDASGTPAGSGSSATDGTMFHVKGQKFANNSTITFLLDSTTLDTHPESDASGSFSTDLPVTSAWSVGKHKLTAHDAGNNTTNTGAQISIVQQGEAHTPGPKGARPDDATFTVDVSAQGRWDDNTRFDTTFVLKVTGQHQPQVCTDYADDTPQSGTITFEGQTFQDQSTYTCTGTYKGGMITYTETLQAMNIFDSKGNTCSLSSPQRSYLQITGSYADQQFSGSITQKAIDETQFTCQLPFNGLQGASGTWIGTVS